MYDLGLNWLILEESTACPSPPSPSTPPPSGCGYPDYKDDKYCDDENNNAGCEWDGGDCCQANPSSGWDNYCEVCNANRLKKVQFIHFPLRYVSV